MREIRTSGSEGGGAGNSTGSPYPYRDHGPLARLPARLAQVVGIEERGECRRCLLTGGITG